MCRSIFFLIIFIFFSSYIEKKAENKDEPIWNQNRSII